MKKLLIVSHSPSPNAQTLTDAVLKGVANKAIEDVELSCGCSVQTFVSTSSDVKKAIAKYYKDK